MDQLHALVYVSTAKRGLSQAEIDHMLERARARNLKEGVTGVLLYSYGNFMQYIEGPAAGLSTVYEAIRSSPLHGGIIELLREPIARREFLDWTMAFRSISPFGACEPPEVNKVFDENVKPVGSTSSAAYALLSKFWNKGVHPPAF